MASTYRAKHVTREERRNAIMRAAYPSRVSPQAPRRSRSGRSESSRPGDASAAAYSQSPAVRLGLPLPADPVRAARAMRTPAEVLPRCSAAFTLSILPVWHIWHGSDTYSTVLLISLTCSEMRLPWFMRSSEQTFCSKTCNQAMRKETRTVTAVGMNGHNM